MLPLQAEILTSLIVTELLYTMTVGLTFPELFTSFCSSHVETERRNSQNVSLLLNLLYKMTVVLTFEKDKIDLKLL